MILDFPSASHSIDHFLAMKIGQGAMLDLHIYFSRAKKHMIGDPLHYHDECTAIEI